MTDAPTTSAPRFSRRERLTLALLLGAGFMLSVDFSILNVALPAVGDSVGLDPAALPWIAAAYALPAAGFTLLFGRLADLLGRRRMFLAGMLLLVVASLVGGFAANPAMLLTARAAQGLSAAITIPASLSILTTTFAEGPARNRVLGLNGAMLSAGFTVGALLGGTIVSLWTWRAAFLVNVPVAILILALTPFLIAESRVPARPKLDVPGAITVTGGLLALVFGIIERNIVAGVVGIALLVAFWLIELRAPAPLAPVRILTRATVKWGNYAGLIIFSMETAMIFLLTLYLQRVLALDPLATGLIFGIPGLASVWAGVVAGRFLGRFGYRAVLVTALALQGLTAIPLIFLGDEPQALVVLVPVLFVNFFVHVTAIVAFTVTSTSGLLDHDQGLATGLTTMTQNIGITVGIPVLSAIAATQATELAGIHLGIAVGAVVVVGSSALVWAGLRPRRQRAVDERILSQVDSAP